MTGNRFAELIKQAFCPFLGELGFKAEEPLLSGRYYRARFVGRQHTLVVSFEPGDDFLVVMLVTNDDDNLEAIDDPQKTPRLNDLNRMHMAGVTQLERMSNEGFFSSIEVEDRNEQALLKGAKDLRLVLPRHLKVF
jgi:hypothetical protein